jgi:ketosteroid isomerase-like protein
MDTATDVVRRLYEVRRAGDPDALRPLLHDDVSWQEPEVDDHMGLLVGPDAVVDMVRRALATTGGTFALEVTETVATGNACAAVIAWRAETGGRTVHGRELAVFGVRDGRIASASFLPEDLGDDEAFWGEG